MQQAVLACACCLEVTSSKFNCQCVISGGVSIRLVYHMWSG